MPAEHEGEDQAEGRGKEEGGSSSRRPSYNGGRGQGNSADAAEEYNPHNKPPMSRSEMKMLETAARNRWPIPDNIKQASVVKLAMIIASSKENSRTQVAAIRTMAELDRLNVMRDALDRGTQEDQPFYVPDATVVGTIDHSWDEQRGVRKRPQDMTDEELETALAKALRVRALGEAKHRCPWGGEEMTDEVLFESMAEATGATVAQLRKLSDEDLTKVADRLWQPDPDEKVRRP
jgi:hypothetical protein